VHLESLTFSTGSTAAPGWVLFGIKVEGLQNWPRTLVIKKKLVMISKHNTDEGGRGRTTGSEICVTLPKAGQKRKAEGGGRGRGWAFFASLGGNGEKEPSGKKKLTGGEALYRDLLKGVWGQKTHPLGRNKEISSGETDLGRELDQDVSHKWDFLRPAAP